MSLPVRPGMTVPLPGHLHAQADGLRELADLGYTDIWSSEADGADAFTPLALAAAWEPRLRLGTAIVPAFTRAPACLAQSVASLADAAPGRFAIGIGSSSNVIVERWNGVPFVEPYQRVRDVVRFLKDALSGEKVAKRYDSFEISGFKLGVRPEVPPTILVAALREGMLRLA
ncbi:MAG TPA: LLM class flavin-dependent oxidoreductase, partial [Acidimicrobiales bacterium]